MSTLARFKQAQARTPGGYEAALQEIESGQKRGHWIWYVFPQLTGLGHSPAAVEFGIHGAAEAAEYLRDAELRQRLLTITRAAAAQLAAGRPLRSLMGSHIDAVKLVSSMTLFEAIAARLQAEGGDDVYRRLAAAAREILAAAAAQGYPACAYTLDRIGSTQSGLPDAR
jgi:uncharacterized protein (DUF1810 family)